MAQFPLLKLTRTGQEMTGMSQGGGKLTFVRVELGDGELKEGDSIETLTALKHGVMQLPLQGYQSEGNGKARLRFIVDNSALAAGFINREIGVFAKIENGAEQLYAYTNAGNYADWIPSKETPIDGDIVDLHIVIGNASHVVLETQNGAYATKIDLEEHRTAAELDHPEKSVKRKHLADNVYTLPAPEAMNAARFVGGDHKVRDVTPGSIGAYSKDEVDSRVNAKVNKSGDTITANLRFDGTNVGLTSSSGYMQFGGTDTGDAIAGGNGANVNIGSLYGIGFYSIQTKKYTGSMDLRNGDWRTVGSMTANKFVTTDGYRCLENNGLFFEKYGGGWYMSDNDWIRVHGNKNIYTGGKIKADGGFEGALHGRADSAGNSDTLGGQSLQWIINQINAAKTGIVAGNLAQNGWVKFANGLIVQWGSIRNDEYNMFPVAYTQWVHVFLVAGISGKTQEDRSTTYGATLVGDPTLTKFYPLVGNTEYEGGVPNKTGVGRWMSIGV